MDQGPEGHYGLVDAAEVIESPMPAIRVFSPGYEFLDSDGRPTKRPSDRIVPPNSAPLGLPLGGLKLGKRRTPY